MSNIYDDRGIYLGSVDENGYMYDSSGTYLGSIRSDGSIYDDTIRQLQPRFRLRYRNN